MAASARWQPGSAEPTDAPPPVGSTRWAEAEEAELVDAAVQGDAHAFAALYDRHLDRVFRQCYYRTGSRADAEDLTQQTFLQAWQAIGRYRRGTSPFIAWLLTISQNLARSHHRTAHAIPVADVALPGDLADADPTAALEMALTRDAVRAAILQLRPARQQVILLHVIAGCSISEVAAVLGKTENNVRVIQHRALADLRRLLTGPAPEVPPGPANLADRLRTVIQASLGRAAGR